MPGAKTNDRSSMSLELDYQCVGIRMGDKLQARGCCNAVVHAKSWRNVGEAPVDSACSLPYSSSDGRV